MNGVITSKLPTYSPSSSTYYPTTISSSPTESFPATAETDIPTYLTVESLPTQSPTYLTNAETDTPTYLTVESLPTQSPTYLTNAETETPTYLTIESLPTQSPTYLTEAETDTPTYLTVESLPTQSPTYLTNADTDTPTYLTIESLPTQSPTYLTEAETDTPTYLTVESLPTQSPTYLVAELQRSNPCPDVLSRSETLEPDLTFSYEIIVEDDRDLLFCSELVYEGEGWLGLGISGNGDMIGSTAVIGLPDSNDVTNPGLYSLDGKTNSLVRILPPEEQTLLGSSIVQENGVTVMRFAKSINESSEDFVIKVPGVTTFIYAASDSNEFGYHGMKRGSVTLVLSNAKSWKKSKKKGTKNIAPPMKDDLLPLDERHGRAL